MRPGIEPGSPRWETSSLTTQPPRPLVNVDIDEHAACCSMGWRSTRDSSTVLITQLSYCNIRALAFPTTRSATPPPGNKPTLHCIDKTQSGLQWKNLLGSITPRLDHRSSREPDQMSASVSAIPISLRPHDQQAVEWTSHPHAPSNGCSRQGGWAASAAFTWRGGEGAARETCFLTVSRRRAITWSLARAVKATPQSSHAVAQALYQAVDKYTQTIWRGYCRLASDQPLFGEQYSADPYDRRTGIDRTIGMGLCGLWRRIAKYCLGLVWTVDREFHFVYKFSQGHGHGVKVTDVRSSSLSRRLNVKSSRRVESWRVPLDVAGAGFR
ncbi:hypothetical protein PR048_003880 [Dryococelus australis]|uniref:Uncharacterized protein n=1 Tax=Dryococelus australis TaxID=614101 RepID=A0ABQ9IPB1_9NEOP|nr:hypothetical protein PR048_003880 [Dryococelus australis]